MKAPNNSIRLLAVLFTIAFSTLLVRASDNVTASELYSFPIGPTAPYGSLIAGDDGAFYGVSGGGSNELGTIFKLTTNGIITTVVEFNGTNGGGTVSLTKAPDGTFFGTTSTGGTNSLWLRRYGTIFKLHADGSLTNIYTFSGSQQGRYPNGVLLASDGNLYGTTQYGGQSSDGTVFQLTPDGQLTTLLTFRGTNGSNPISTLIEGSDGLLYGTTSYGGTNNRGTLFRISKTGTHEVLFHFNGINGAFPEFPLVEGDDGQFYGITARGGTNWSDIGYTVTYGTIFKIASTGQFTKLLDLTASPHGPFIKAPTGVMFAVFGSWYAGGVYSFTTNGNFQLFASLNSLQAGPSGGLLADKGDFYGLCSFGGIGGGIAYKVTTNAVTRVASFDTYDYPSPVCEGSDGYLYGTTQKGGANGESTIFKLTSAGEYATLATFSADEIVSQGLTEGADGCLYGFVSDPSFGQRAFKVTKDGIVTRFLTSPFYFEGSSLVLGNDGLLYGATYEGVFRLTANGSREAVASLPYETFGSSFGQLMQAKDGTFYGFSHYGGSTNNHGVFFKVTTNGIATRLTAFVEPFGWFFDELVEGPDGCFYGFTDHSVFKLTTSGVLSTLASSEYYLRLSGALVPGSDGNLYASDWSGELQQVTLDGVVTEAFNFGLLTSSSMQLSSAKNGDIYGSRSSGGSRGGGSIVRFIIAQLAPTIVTEPQNVTAAQGTNVVFAVEATGTQPLAYQWQKDGTIIPGATSSKLVLPSVQIDDVGDYKVVVTNYLGSVISSNATLSVFVPAVPPAPTSLVATTLTAHAISLRWQSAGTNVSSFIVWRGPSPTSTSLKVATVGPAARAFTNYNLAPATTYYYRVQAVNWVGPSSKSGAAVAQTFELPPIAPASVTTVPLGPNRVSVSWEIRSTNANWFRVLRSFATEGPYSTLAVLGANALSYVDSTPHSGLTYYYVVSAMNSAGSASSLPAAATLPVGLRDNLVWQNTNGQFVVWVMKGTNFVRYSNMTTGPAAATGWRVAAFGDINRDSHTDLIWQKQNGELMAWLMNGTSRARSVSLGLGPASDTHWSIIGAADFTGDRKNDLLWRNDHGAIACWTMDDTSYVRYFPLPTGPTLGSGWMISGVPDIDRNGKADILWVKTNGMTTAWLMDRTNYLSTATLADGFAADAGWRLSAVVDLNSDGSSDFVWANTNGRVTAMLMNRTNYVHSVALRTNTALNGWRLIGPR